MSLHGPWLLLGSVDAGIYETLEHQIRQVFKFFKFAGCNLGSPRMRVSRDMSYVGT